MLYGNPNNANQPQIFAAQYLELTPTITDDLFTPDEHDEDQADDYNIDRVIYRDINAGMAAKVLRHLATTGDVDWNQAYS